MPFDRYGKELHELTEAKAGKRTADATFWLILAATWVVALTVIVGAVVLATKFLLPYVSVLSRIPLPQVGQAVLSFAIASVVVALAGVWFLKTFRRTRDKIVQFFSASLADIHGVLEQFGDRIQYLESHAASVASVKSELQDIDSRLRNITPPPLPTLDLTEPNTVQQLLIQQLLSSASIDSVGHPFMIHEAVYGVEGGKEIDVKELLMQNMKDNRIRLKVSNKTMGRDPQYGAPKRLRVRYGSPDVVREVIVNEGEELRIPD